MTAPTHPEPRPDDEGRETEPACAICGASGKLAVQGLSRWIGGEWVCIGPHATPHPAPLGATRSMTPEEVESQKQFRRSVSRPVGATDEGLREAVRAFLASWDAMAPFTTKDAPMIAALRASLQAGG